MRKYVYHRQTSSHIDALAKAGVCFDNYDATDTPGLPSCPALFPGRFGTCTGAINHGGEYADLPSQGAGRPFTSGLEG